MQSRDLRSRQSQNGRQVLVICSNPVLAETVCSALAGIGVTNVTQLSEPPECYRIDALINGLEICLIEVSSKQSLSSLSFRRIASASVPVIALQPYYDLELQLECLRQGVSEFVSAPIDAAQLQHAVDRIAARRQYESRLSRQPGAIYAVMSGKGGSGCTTIATHLALCLARARSHRTLLVDLDGITGSVNLILGVKPAFSLLDCATDLDRMDEELWNKLLARAGPLDTLVAPANPTRLEMPPDGLSRILDFWRTLYDVVILDLPSSPNEFSLECARRADLLLLISACDLASIYSTARQSAHLESCGIRPGASKVVLNRFQSPAALETWNQVIGRPVFARISEVGQALEKTLLDGNSGPGSNSRFQADITLLAQQLTGWNLEPNRERYQPIQWCKAFIGWLRTRLQAKPPLQSGARIPERTLP